ISDDIIDRIFEPYFTTKHQSQGTGIGLYMSEEIVTKHLDGELIASNEQSIFDNNSYKGAQFIISIPLDDENKL
ncbi:MAG: ATP-binding protein, partial [Poseidonibacter sp.]